MPRFIYALKAILTGMIISQVLSTLHVYLSNIELYKSITAIHKAGYLAIPNQHIIPSLKSIIPALCGGLLFTVTVGACLSILSLISAWFWARVLSRNKVFFILLLALWSGSIWAANSQGLSLMVTAYFLCIPPVVFTASLKWLPEPDEHKIPLKITIHVTSFIILAFICYNRLNVDMFFSIRDYLLLSNPVGRIVNNFYYKYNLYAAQSFKSLDQKVLKSCDLSLIDDTDLARRIADKLIVYDYLILDNEQGIDLKIEKTKGGLALIHQNREILKTTPKEFLHKPEHILREFSEKCDKHVFFRWFTFFSLLFVSSLTLYLSLYTPFYLVSEFFLSSISASIVAGLLCCMVGLVLLLPSQFEKAMRLNNVNLAKTLESDNWHHRVAALKVIKQKGIEIGDLPAHTRILTSPHVLERYWLAIAMSVSRDSNTYRELLKLLDDPQINVVCGALYALGRRSEPKAVSHILKVIKTSNIWYNQEYAYRALRNIGWNQAILK